MSSCRYCPVEIVWVPTVEGVRPFEVPVSLPPNTPVAVLKSHDCPEREKMIKDAQQAYALELQRDPAIRAASARVSCPKCDQSPEHACIDLRTTMPRTTKHPHFERLVAGAQLLQDSA